MTDTGTTATSVSERITNLDTVRGVATLGILAMNGVSYGLPDAAYSNLEAAGSSTRLDWIVGVLGEILVDQKSMALFSLLFGAGIVMFADRAEAKGRRPVWLSLWRNLLLLGLGIAHTSIWDGDILTVYALCSPLLLLLRKRSARTLLIVGSTLVLSSAGLSVLTQLAADVTAAELGSFWFVDGGPLGNTVGVFVISDFFLRALGMMLIGVALYRLGVVQGTRTPELYRRMVCWGFGIGVPLTVLGVVVQVDGEWGVDTALIGLAPNTVATIPMTLGYLGLITLWDQHGETAVHERVRAVGRMALTNYLTQTIIGIVVLRVVFDRGQFGRAAIFGFVVAVWVLQLAWSKLWLDRFGFGPVEWLWRVATYRRWQAIPGRR